MNDHLRAGFQKELRSLLGLSFTSNRISALDRGVYRAAARIADAGAGTSPEALLDLLRSRNPAAVAVLIDELTVGETYFFRDAHHFAFLRDFLRSHVSASGAVPIRLWSAGCASGEEAYTMAIVALETLGEDAARRVEIIATDVHEGALARAHAGRYRAWSFRGLAPKTRDRWFTPSGPCWQIHDRVRHLVRFGRLNLLDIASPSWPRDIAVTFCRNVLLYLDDAAIAVACTGIRDALVPAGWLVTAPCDPLLICDGLHTDVRQGFLAYRRSIVARPAESALALVLPPRPAPPPRPASPPPVVHESPRMPARLQAPTTVPPPGEVLAAARQHADRGDVEAALRMLDTLLEQRSGDRDEQRPGAHAPAASLEMAVGYLLRAILRQGMGDHGGAVADTRRALLLDRSLAFAHVLAATSCAALGDEQAARQALRNARRALRSLSSDDPVAGTQDVTAGEMLALCGQLDHAFTRTNAGGRS